MVDALGFVLKMILAAALVSLGIKTLGPLLALPATAAVSVAIVLTPSVAIATLLAWQMRRSP